jgi:hypothetical protein
MQSLQAYNNTDYKLEHRELAWSKVSENHDTREHRLVSSKLKKHENEDACFGFELLVISGLTKQVQRTNLEKRKLP